MRRRAVLSAFVPLMSLALALAAFGCGKKRGGGGDDEVVVEPKSDENGVVVATIDTSSGDTQVLKASADNPELEGAEVLFPPGSLAVPADVTIQQGETLVSERLLADAGIPDDTEGAGPTVLVTASEDIDATQPFTVALPFDPEAQGALHLAPKMLAVLYLVKKAGEEKLYVGIIPASELEIVDGVVRLKTKYFGAFQVIVAVSGLDETKEASTDEAFKPKPLDTSTGTKTSMKTTTSTGTSTSTGTDTEPAIGAPAVESMTPSGSTAEPDVTISLTFDLEVDEASAVDGGVTLATGANGTGPAPAYTVAVDGKTVTLAVSRRLTLGQKYTVWVNGSLEAVGGAARDSDPEAHAFTVRSGAWAANESGEVGTDFPRTQPYNTDRLSAHDSGYSLAVDSGSDFGAYVTDAAGAMHATPLTSIASASIYTVKMLPGADGKDYYAWNADEFGPSRRILVDRAGTPFSAPMDAAKVGSDTFIGSNFHYFLGHDGKTTQSYVLTVEDDPQTADDIVIRERLIGASTADAVEVGTEGIGTDSITYAAFHSARDGRAILVLVSSNVTPAAKVYLRTKAGAWIKSDLAGGPVFSPTGTIQCVDAKVLDGDGYALGWVESDSSAVTTYLMRAEGTTWSNPAEAEYPHGVGEPVYAQIAVGVGGGAAVQFEAQSDIYGWAHNGSSWGNPESFAAGASWDRSLVGVDAAGHAVIAWRTTGTENYGIRAWHFDSTAWAATAEIVESGRDYVEFHGMAVEDSGRVYLVWSDDPDVTGPGAATVVRGVFK
jgi:hypothetical protein